jgi:hypothetical protein
MGKEPATRRVLTGIAVVVLLALAVAAGYSFGSARSRLPTRKEEPAAPSPAPTYDPSKGFPRADAPRPVDPRVAEPGAVAARSAAIHQAAEAIRAECRAAGGDWEAWQRTTEQYRGALRARVQALKDAGLAGPNDAGLNCEALAGNQGFPLFEIGARQRLSYLFDPASLDEFRREQSVVAAQGWLAARGIDLIFVPVPKMTEVYIEHFVDPCPADGIVAPHVRRTLLDLLEHDVEVVDGFRLFRPLRDTDAEYLYATADTHWGPRAMRIMAKEVADRIERYRFGARARYALPIVKTNIGGYWQCLSRSMADKYTGFQDGLFVLTEQQQRLAAPVQTTNTLDVTMPDGSVPPDDPRSPVLLIGHSYLRHFRELLIRELNLLPQTNSSANGTTEFFGDFLRDPELLAQTRVVIWITTEAHMTQFKPMPAPILMDLPSSN